MSLQSALAVTRPEHTLVNPVLQLLAEGAPYNQVLPIIGPARDLGLEYWPQVALVHQAVVACNPAVAETWLTAAVEPLVEPNSRWTGHSYWLGSTIGLLQAGVWLDQHCGGENQFNYRLLTEIGRVLCGPGQCSVHTHNLTTYGFQDKLAEVARTYLLPRENKERRLHELAGMIQFISQHGKEENFNSFNRLILRSLCQPVLNALSATSLVRNLGHIFATTGITTLTDLVVTDNAP